MKKENLSTVILILCFLTGLSLLLYPTVSDYINSVNQTKAINDYAVEVSNLENELYDELIQDAREYNASLLDKFNPYAMSEENMAEYESLLNVAGGIIGYIEIPRIQCSLPIYHSVDEAVLQVAIGHIEWSSLPVGGESTHALLSGHRGLPSARLFTDLDKVLVGDTFIIRVLDEMLTYEVDQILIVEPNDTSALLIEDGQDLCTLITCTPYGINSHRLLVRGHRIENQVEAKVIRVTADALLIEPLMVAPVVAAPMLAVLLVVFLVTTRKKR